MTSSPQRTSRPGRSTPPQCCWAEMVLWSVGTMKSSPQSTARALTSAGVCSPSECSVWRWRSPRYHPGISLIIDVDSLGTNARPGGRLSIVTTSVQSRPSLPMEWGLRAMCQVPAVIGPARYPGVARDSEISRRRRPRRPPWLQPRNPASLPSS
ncbi:MAG: hypothetical protein E6I76_13485 [Chloroflexi bacterium]|nr:MAG: hypothetical protein E6I76_13485 [Chloroflexota bacterium]